MPNQHWSELSKNPISEAAQTFVAKQLSENYGGRIPDLEKFWHDTLAGKALLDIGVVEHALEFFERPGWAHGKFAELASRTVGIDILADQGTAAAALRSDEDLAQPHRLE